MTFFWLINALLPPVFMAAFLMNLVRQRSPQLQSLNPVLALGLTASVSLLLSYGRLDLKELVARGPYDYSFEHACWFAAAVAASTSAWWPYKNRGRSSYVTLAAASYLFLVWCLMCVGPIV
jgi:hypothetical protein